MYDGFISYSHAADGLLAPRLQSALQRFAKPWWKRRAVRIFRDESSLSANPHLWSSITEALDTSGWFVLLLSPDAAQSEWVNQEIAYWVETRGASRILPVLTGGILEWRDGDLAGSAVPAALKDVFEEEPRWVDLRFADGSEQLDLKDPRFSAAVADLASAIRGIPKDELVSEDVQQHRRTMRTAWAGVVLLVALVLSTGAVAIYAFGQRQLAEQQTAAARTAEAAAQDAADEALAARDAARDSEQAAVEQAAIVETRSLIASARSASASSQLSLLLLLEALDRAPDDQLALEVLLELREVVSQDRLLMRIPIDGSRNHAALASDGKTIFHSSELGVRAIDLESGDALWSISAGEAGAFGLIAVDGASRFVAVAVEAPGGSVWVLDPDTGQKVAELPRQGCEGVFALRFSSDGGELAFSDGTAECGLRAEADWATAYSTTDWSETRRYLEPGRFYETLQVLGDGSDALQTHWLNDGTAYGTGLHGGPLRIDRAPPELDADVSPAATFAIADGTGDFVAFLPSVSSDPVVVDVARSNAVSIGVRSPSNQFAERYNHWESNPLALSGDGSLVAVIFKTTADKVFDTRTGALLLTLGYDGPTFDQSWSLDGSVLLTVHDDALRLWDIADDPRRRLEIEAAGDLVAVAIERLNRGFTRGECQTFSITDCPLTVDQVRSKRSG